MDKITINVTQDDIDNGTPQSTMYCPVALSLRRTYPKADFVTVGINNASVYIPKKKFLGIFTRNTEFIRINLPKRASKFIVNYDTYGPKDEHVKPFTFEAETERIKD